MREGLVRGGGGLGMANARPQICKCPNPGTDKAGKCPAVAPGKGGGGGGRLGAPGNLLMHKNTEIRTRVKLLAFTVCEEITCKR